MENENVIFDYLRDKLNEEQKQDFEQRLESDHDFHQEYLLQKQMYAYLNERSNREAYTSEIENLNAKYFQSDGSQSKWSLKRVIILAVILLTSVFAAWYLLKPKEVDLYESHAEHFALHLVLKSDDSDIASDAESAFNQGEYQVAVAAIQKYLENNSIDTKARLALGISMLESGDEDKALDIFEEISAGSSTLKDYGTWYVGLYHVKKRDYSKAQKILNTIPKSDVQLHNKAQKLLEEIKSIKVEESN